MATKLNKRIFCLSGVRIEQYEKWREAEVAGSRNMAGRAPSAEVDGRTDLSKIRRFGGNDASSSLLRLRSSSLLLSV